MTQRDESGAVVAAVDEMVQVFGRSVKELRDAEDALITNHSLDNVNRLMFAVDRYWILREELRKAARLSDAVVKTP